MTEEEVSLLLNTFMYLDYKEASDGMKLKEILADLSTLPDYQEGGIHYGEYCILKEASADSRIGDLVIGNQSHLLGYDSGTNACTFAEEGGNTYVVYRGTADGEWFDNGLGMTSESTLQQERALAYFEEVVEREQISPGDRLIVSGHSKGGNKAQFVTMNTKYDGLLDACYSIDGQGFSEEAMLSFYRKWGVFEYRKRAEKIIGICGENDYVSSLLNCVILPENRYYIKTPVDRENFVGYHDIKYLFETEEITDANGKVSTIFHGKKNPYTAGKGELGNWAMALSDEIMKLPPKKRKGCAAFLMQFMELKGKRKGGLNGERLRLSDAETFLELGIPVIIKTLLDSEEGWRFLDEVKSGGSFASEMQGSVCFKAYGRGFYRQSDRVLDFQRKGAELIKKLEFLADEMDVYMKGNPLLKHRLMTEKRRLEERLDALKEIADLLKVSGDLYGKKDRAAKDAFLQVGSFQG